MNTFKLDIITPTSIKSYDDVDYLRIPSLDGLTGIKAKHAPAIIALDIGELKIETKNGAEWYATSGGFVEITDEKVELLLESIEKSNEIDVKRASEALERAKQRRADNKEDIDELCKAIENCRKVFNLK